MILSLYPLVAMVPSLESTSDILLTAIIGADQSARDEPALEPTPPTVTTEPVSIIIRVVSDGQVVKAPVPIICFSPNWPFTV